MSKIIILSLVLAAWLGASAVRAEDTPVKFKSTGEGDVHTEAGYSPSDPLQGKPVNKEWDAGHPSTQAPYDENCTDDRCVRAKQRQLGTTTWQEDRESGLHKSPGKAKSAAPTQAAPDTGSSSGSSSKPSGASAPSGGSGDSGSDLSNWKPE